MKTSQSAGRARKTLNELRDDLELLTPSRLTHAMANLEAWSGVGYPAGVGSSSIGRSRGVSDPTGEAAERSLERGDRDRYGRELAELDQAITTARIAVARANKLVEASTTRQPSELQQVGTPGCESCARGELRTPAPHPEAWQERYSGRLCSFCYEFDGRYGVRPAFEIILWHLDNLGRQVPHTMIRSHHPNEFKRYHEARSSA